MGYRTRCCRVAGKGSAPKYVHIFDIACRQYPDDVLLMDATEPRLESVGHPEQSGLHSSGTGSLRVTIGWVRRYKDPFES